MLKIPQNKKWIISYLGDFFGHIINAFNINLFNSQGRVKVGDNFELHTETKAPSGFCSAKIATGESGGVRTHKTWAVAENKILKSEDFGEFEEDTGVNLGNTDEGSDILSLKDDTEEEITSLQYSVAGNDDIKITGEGSTQKWAQTIELHGYMKDIVMNIKKVGSPTDNFKIDIQEDNDGSPSGVSIISKTIAGTELTTSYITETFDFSDDEKLLVNKTYWIIFERDGVASFVNYYVIRFIGTEEKHTDPYASGELKSWNGSVWKSWKLPDNTDETLPTADNAVSGETGWTNPQCAYGSWATSDTAYARADASIEAAKKHVWKGFGFNIPSSAIIKGIEVKIRCSFSVSTYGNMPIRTYLTKNANDAVNSVRYCGITTTPTTYTMGGVDDLWKVDWTPAEINSNDFGVRLENWLGAEGVTVQHRVMSLYVSVYYQEEDTENENYLDAEMKVQTSFPSAEERLYVSTTNDIVFTDEENSQWYSLWQGILKQEELNKDYPRVLKSWGINQVLFVGNDNKVSSISHRASDSTYADYGRLTLPPSHFVKWMVATKTSLFIGLENKDSANLPSLVIYYEPFSEYTRILDIPEGSTIGFLMNENCYIIDIRGKLRTWTGVRFEDINYLPTYFLGKSITLPHRNAFAQHEGNTHFLWKGEYPYPMGVWIYENTQFYHKGSFLPDSNSYGSLEGTCKALYSDGTNLLAGGSVSTGGETLEGIFNNITGNRGWIITPKIQSEQINNIWQNIVLKYLPVKPSVSSGNFVVKYRTEPSKIGEGINADEFNGEWTSSTTFTCSDALFTGHITAESIEVGNEVIIRTGQCAGLIAHITDITEGVITIDEEVEVESGTFTFSIENWKKINFTEFKNTKFSNIASIGDKKAEWIQFKIEIRKDYELEEIQINTITDSTINKK